MMIETSEGIRLEIHGDPDLGGVAIYDNSDGTTSGTVAFDFLDFEVGEPVRFQWGEEIAELDFGVVVSTLTIRSS